MIPQSYQLRDLTIRPGTILAPMAGVTDTLFRRVIRGLGSCGLLMTEFTSSEGITRSAKKTLRYLYFQEDEHPIAAQLFGANPQVMADAARMVEDLGYDAVDINLGCPAKKVVKCGGSGLLRDLPLLARNLPLRPRRRENSAHRQSPRRLGRKLHRRRGRRENRARRASKPSPSTRARARKATAAPPTGTSSPP